MAAIDVGATAINRNSSWSSNWTLLSKDNPANLTGKLTSIECWFYNSATNVRIGTYYLVSGTTYKLRDSVIIPSITGGALITLSVNLNIVEGDLIGFFGANGSIEYTDNSGGGVWVYNGDSGTGNASYSSITKSAMSLYGIGTTDIASNTKFLQFF